MNKRLNLNQLSLPFGEGKRSIALSYEDRARAFWLLTGALFFSFIVYFYAVNATAHHVAERTALEHEASDLGASLATLEFQAIVRKSDVTLEVARSYGFSEVREPLYVAGKPDTALSFNAARQ